MLTLCTIASDIIRASVNEPPYDRNGNGTPVNGIIANKPPKLTII